MDNFNVTFNEDITNEEFSILDIWGMIHIFLEMVIDTLSLVSSMFLVVVILKFERLRYNPSLYLFHYAIATVVSFLLCPMIFYMMLAQEESLGEWTCVIFHVEAISATLSYVFVTLSLVDLWIQCNDSWREKLSNRKVHLCLVLTLYGGFLGYFIGVIVTSCGHFFYLTYELSEVLFFILVVTVSVIKFVVFGRANFDNTRHGYVLTVSTFVILGCAPTKFLHVAANLSGIWLIGQSSLEVFVVLILDVTKLFAYSIPFIVVIMLGIVSNDFKMCYDKLWKNIRMSRKSTADCVESNCLV